ncbi:MAG: FBP domain-containing protein [Actinomycetota bacterium]|nr:FBP domain-containing protein [Actinomycetota bacterium]
MHALTESAIRSSLVNASVRERKALGLPQGFPGLPWEEMDFLGWRDPRSPQTGYLVIPLDDMFVGIILRLGGRQARTRPQCSFCRDVHLPNEVSFFSAKLSGAAGRKGDTVGILMCSRFECSANVRVLPSAMFAGDDPEVVRQQRIAALRKHLGGFARRILEG